MPSDFSNWQAASTSLRLEKNQVHVWRIALDRVAQADVEHYLSEDERGRAARYHFERDRVRFVRGRGVLRILLAQYLEQKPAQICFSYNALGKPLVNGIEFNLSHANDWMLLAITRDVLVGIDVETGRANLDFMSIAERFFSKEEYLGLESLRDEERLEQFLNLWTRKEAVTKAIGTGVSQNFTNLPDASQWSLYALEPAPQYHAALAVKSAPYEIFLFNYVANTF